MGTVHELLEARASKAPLPQASTATWWRPPPPIWATRMARSTSSTVAGRNALCHTGGCRMISLGR
ncbi:hypothetical protein ACFQU2_42180 [Siccirubricoccus deserti]